MKIYNYNSENGYFVGESLADESPLEPGVYLIPAHATEIVAPKATEGKVAVFVNDAWELQDLPKEPVIDLEALEAKTKAKAEAKAQVLAQLGITEEQAKLLLS